MGCFTAIYDRYGDTPEQFILKRGKHICAVEGDPTVTIFATTIITITIITTINITITIGITTTITITIINITRRIRPRLRNPRTRIARCTTPTDWRTRVWGAAYVAVWRRCVDAWQIGVWTDGYMRVRVCFWLSSPTRSVD